MAESELGTAVLSLRIETGPALQALTQFRQQIERELQNSGTVNFKGLEENARQSGQRAGKAIAEGVSQATKGIQFESIREALDFSGALNGTLRDLKQYRDALVALRDVTNATAPGFYELNDAIEAASQAIKNYSAGTDQLQDQAAKVAAKELTDELRRQRDVVLDNARADRQWGDAIRTIEGAQRSAAAATREANKAFRDQVLAAGSLAKAGAGGIAGAVGAVGRGVGAVARGAVSAGRAGYNLGAEFGVFEEPRTGPVKKAIQDVIDRFKFLGEQAETTRGIILRSFEGAGAAAGLAAIAQNADQLKAALTGLSTAAKATDTAVGGIAKFGQYLADVFNNGGWLTDNGKTIIGQLLNISAATEKAGATAVSLGDQLIQLGAGAAGGALNGLQAVTTAIGSIPPEAQAAVLALAGLSVGFKEKPIVEGLTTVLEYLDNLKGKSLQVRGDLQTVLQGLGEFEQKVNGQNNQNLLPSFTERGLQNLDDSVRQGESFRRISDAIGSQWERGTRYLEKANAEMRRLVEQGLELKQLGAGPSGIVPRQTNLLPPGAPASFRPDPNAYATPIGPALPRDLFEDDLAAVQARRLAIEQDIAEAKAETLRLAEIENKRGREIGRLNAVSLDGRLPGGGFAPGSPGALSARNRQLREAGANALIGGAFPALFGQGLGASVGGALGGGAGGLVGGQFGFGLSLLGTALGAQFDQATQKLQTLGSALNDPIKQFSALSEAGLISTKGLERQIQALIDTGREAEAAALIQKDLASTYGEVEGAKELAAASDELGRAWAQLQVSVASLVGSPIAGLLSDTATSVSLFADSLRFLKNAIPEPIRQLGGPLNALLPGSGIARLFGRSAPTAAARGEDSTSPALEQARAKREEIVRLTTQQITADAQNNKVLSTGLQIQRSRLEEQQKLAALSKEEAAGPRGQAIRDAGAQERLRLAEAAAEAARSTGRELANAQELVSLYGQARQIREEELRIAEAKRVADQAAAAYSNRPSGLAAQDDRALANERDAAANRYNTILIEGQRRIRDLEMQRWAEGIAAANQIKSIQEEVAIQQQRGGLTGLGVGALQALKSFRDAQRAEQDAQAALRADPGNSGLANASEAAAANVELAAAKTKADLQEAFRSAQEAVRSISRGIEDAVTALNAARGGAEGVNKYIDPQQARDRQAAANVQLFREASQLAKELGVNARFVGGLTERNSQLSDFINSARQELRGQQDINLNYENLARANNDLAVVNQSLVSITTQLAEATANLASKDWNVYVNVPSTASLPRGVEVYQ